MLIDAPRYTYGNKKKGKGHELGEATSNEDAKKLLKQLNQMY